MRESTAEKIPEELRGIKKETEGKGGKFEIRPGGYSIAGDEKTREKVKTAVRKKPELEVIEGGLNKEPAIFNTIEEVMNAREELEDEVVKRDKEAEEGKEEAKGMSWEEYKDRFKALNGEYLRLKKEEFDEREAQEKLRDVS